MVDVALVNAGNGDDDGGGDCGDPLQSILDIMIVCPAPKCIGMPPEKFFRVTSDVKSHPFWEALNVHYREIMCI